MTDRGCETTNALTEVRTVLSRAETALTLLESGPSEWHHEVEWVDGERHLKDWRESDPDQDDMVDALREVVVMLARWRRTGRARKTV